jgi:hypothetical protein
MPIAHVAAREIPALRVKFTHWGRFEGPALNVF